MSEILNRLKQAEQERERVIAERKRLETEADAALDKHEREEVLQRAQRVAADVAAPASAPAQAREPTPQQRSRLAAGMAIGVAVGVAFFIGTRMPRTTAPAAAAVPAAIVVPVAPVAIAPPAPSPALFRLDRDVDAFAARVKDKP